ncbi:hypothetical protein PPYR_14184 [Photinus pyralis]|uniref:EGF-like domain-containing protein n=2 Tax=Photinus pyralis TaxID=7054 RepID=A0A5N4A4H4_PHOPY|nr:uncharacterized protein LOC116180880 isoform X2 [Photinus pyralis]KAB0792225.1 hypothetical protein PPYR_14184 [Photinus pyralis]
MFSRSISLAHVMWAAWGWGRRPPGILTPLLFVLRCLSQALATGFHRFLARFSGRRRLLETINHKSPPPWTLLVLLVSTLLSIAEACSSRTTPKPRPPAPTARPNITFHTYECPPAYAAWYCLNGATCFTVKIGDSLVYNCECTEGYMGPRCEYKDLDGSYMPSQRGFMLETASIAGGAAIAVLLVVILCVVIYVNYWRRNKSTRTSADCIDGCASAHRPNQPTFGTRWRTTTATSSDQRDETKQGRVELHQVTTLLTSPNQASRV